MPESNFAFSDNNKKIIYDAVAGEMKKRGFTSIQKSDLIIKIQGVHPDNQITDQGAHITIRYMDIIPITAIHIIGPMIPG